MFKGCESLRKVIVKADNSVGNAPIDNGGARTTGFAYFCQNCPNLEILELLSHIKRVDNIVQGCPKLRYFNMPVENTYTKAQEGFSGASNLITIGDNVKITCLVTGSTVPNLESAKLSLKSAKKMLGAFLGYYTSSNVAVPSTATLGIGIGLQEGLKKRTTPSYVIDAGYYDYDNGSESVDPSYEHNYHDINGNVVIEHDVHEPYISTEQPSDENGNLLTTWSVVKNGVTYWAVGELREALDEALGNTW